MYAIPKLKVHCMPLFHPLNHKMKLKELDTIRFSVYNVHDVADATILSIPLLCVRCCVQSV